MPRHVAPVAQARPLEATASAAAVATSSAATVGKQTIRVTIPRQTPPQGPKRRVLVPEGTTVPPDEENAPPIVIELEQTMAATASSESQATASAMVAHAPVDPFPRAGVLVGTMPGGVALDLELAQVHGVGIDLEGNAEQVGLGASWGDRLFLEGGGFVTYDGAPGLFVGLGARW